MIHCIELNQPASHKVHFRESTEPCRNTVEIHRRNPPKRPARAITASNHIPKRAAMIHVALIMRNLVVIPSHLESISELENSTKH